MRQFRLIPGLRGIRAAAKVQTLDAGASFLLYAREKSVNYQPLEAAASPGLRKPFQKGCMQNLRLFFSIVMSALCLAARPAHAADPEASKEPSFLDKINWTKGPAKADLKTLAEVDVPEGFLFTGANGTQRLLEAMGNPTSGSELGFLAPTSLVWFVVFEFSDVGYVKDDDKDKLDAEKLLKSIKEGTEAANKYREKMGAAPLLGNPAAL